MPDGNALAAWLKNRGIDPKTLKDRTVYGVSRRNASEHNIFEGHVTKKGREYLTTDIFNARFRVREPGDPFLTESDSNGLVSLLFLDKPSLDEYLDQERLASWLRANVGAYCAKASSRQLRAAIAILESADEKTYRTVLGILGGPDGTKENQEGLQE